jgi:hypothetical protein
LPTFEIGLSAQVPTRELYATFTTGASRRAFLREQGLFGTPHPDLKLYAHPGQAAQFKLTHLEWALECRDRKTAQEGAVSLLASMNKALGAWQEFKVRPGSPEAEFIRQVSDLYVRAEPVRTTSWERVLKDVE